MKMKRISREAAPLEKAPTTGLSRTLANPRHLAITLCLVLLTGLVLAACGDNTPTSTAPGTIPR
jgi:hypothetical protein